jgi:hypothetical protein
MSKESSVNTPKSKEVQQAKYSDTKAQTPVQKAVESTQNKVSGVLKK